MKRSSFLKSSAPHRQWVPYLVLLIAVLLTTIATTYVEESSNAKDRLRFLNAVQHTQASVANRLALYISMLRASAALFAADSAVTSQKFASFTGRLEISEHYPGVQGIGFALGVPSVEIDSVEKAARREGLADFTIRPRSGDSEIFLIRYLEPLDRRNRSVLGFNMFSEATRRKAMETARDSGRAVATGKVLLMRLINGRRLPGFLIYLPVYRGGGIPATVAERRRDLIGFVYSPFHTADLLQGTFVGETFPRVDFEVYDGPVLLPSALLYSSNVSRLDTSRTGFWATPHLDVAGRIWTILYLPRPEFDQVSGRVFAPYILVAGLVVSLLFFWLTRAETGARSGAEMIASDLRKSQDTLRLSEARLRRLVDANIVGVILFDVDGRIIEANNAFLAIIGYSLEELKGGAIDLEKLTPEEFREIDRAGIAAVRNNGRHAPYEKEFLCRDGRRVPVMVGAAALDEPGNLAIGFIVDVSERRKIEEALRASEIRFRAMIERSPIAVQLFSLDGRCIQANDSWELLWGVERKVLRDYDIFNDRVFAAHGMMPRIRSAFAGESLVVPPLYYDPSELGWGGRPRWIRLFFYPLRGSDGEPTEIALKIEDVTDRIEAEQQLQIAKDAAEAANRAKDRFLAVLSHELRTPLTPVLSAVAILEEDHNPESRHALVDMIRRNVELEARLIDDLLDLTRIGHGKLKLEPEIVEIHDLLRRTLDVSRTEIERKSQSVSFDLAAAEDAVVGDAARLQQVFWNLISNAVKFTPERGHISIRSFNRDRQLVVEVADDGIGIEPDVLPRIFNAFEQGERTITRRFGGLGLGLAISKMLVDLHGGSLTAISGGMGAGSLFTISLALAPAAGIPAANILETAGG